MVKVLKVMMKMAIGGGELEVMVEVTTDFTESIVCTTITICLYLTMKEKRGFLQTVSQIKAQV